jgi:hypothetical protein
MRSAGNFNPEWGYLAPAPSFMRTARVVVVATAVGATAGAAVVLSLIEHPTVETNNTAIAAHAIVTSVQAATPPVASVGKAATTTVAPPAIAAAPLPAPAVSPPPVIANQSQVPPAGAAASVPPTSASVPVAAPAPQSPPSVAALSEVPPAAELTPPPAPDDSAMAPQEPLPPKKTSKHAGSPNSKNQPNPGLGSVLRHLFTAHAGSSYYPNR